MNLSPAISRTLSHNLCTFKIPDKLSGIFFTRSPGSPFDSIQLHLIRPRLLAGQHIFTLYIAVHHQNNGGIIIHVPDNDGHFPDSRFHACKLAAVSRHDLIAPRCARAHKPRHQYAVLRDALRKLLHFFIIPYLKRMPRKIVQLRDRQHHNTLLRLCLQCPFLAGTEQVSEWGQTRPAQALSCGQASAPPLQAVRRPALPCPWGRSQKCFFQRMGFPPPGHTWGSLS